MKMLFEDAEVECMALNSTLFKEKKLTVLVARLDKLHPVISGNKLFKLHFFIEAALASAHKTILTFGGAYSNHLAATAYACKLYGLKNIGIIRGEKQVDLSHTLMQCQEHEMELHFISRENYKIKQSENILQERYGACIVVPEGGYHPLGAKGASLIMHKLQSLHGTHFCLATGTATTLAGILQQANERQSVISVPVLKNLDDLSERLIWLCGKKIFSNLFIFDDYHFGGYAKKTTMLLNFMNELYTQYHLSTDFVYTAKMLFAVFDKIKKDFFPEGSRIVCLHTGGLQGNDSLPKGTLVF